MAVTLRYKKSMQYVFSARVTYEPQHTLMVTDVAHYYSHSSA